MFRGLIQFLPTPSLCFSTVALFWPDFYWPNKGGEIKVNKEHVICFFLSVQSNTILSELSFHTTIAVHVITDVKSNTLSNAKQNRRARANRHLRYLLIFKSCLSQTRLDGWIKIWSFIEILRHWTWFLYSYNSKKLRGRHC